MRLILLFSVKLLVIERYRSYFIVFSKLVIDMTQDREQSQLAEVGGRIRKLRDARGLNLHELARLCGISASALSLIETGKRDLRVTSLYRIAVALRVAAGELMDAPDQSDSGGSPGESSGYDLRAYK